MDLPGYVGTFVAAGGLSAVAGFAFYVLGVMKRRETASFWPAMGYGFVAFTASQICTAALWGWWGDSEAGRLKIIATTSGLAFCGAFMRTPLIETLVLRMLPESVRKMLENGNGNGKQQRRDREPRGPAPDSDVSGL
jgi:hypothetical protein